jgi:hypothetical protein
VSDSLLTVEKKMTAAITTSKLDRLFHALISGQSLTSKQIAARYRVVNPYDLVYRLRQEIDVRMVSRTNAKGVAIYAYEYVEPMKFLSKTKRRRAA